MRIHAIYDRTGRVLSAAIEQRETCASDVQVRPVPQAGQFGASFKLVDDDAPGSPADFMDSVKVERALTGPRLLLPEDPEGASSAVVGVEIRSESNAPAANAGEDADALDLPEAPGPFAVPALPLNLMLREVSRRRPELAELGFALRDLALAVAMPVFIDALPDIGGAIVEQFALTPAAARRLEGVLTGELPVIPPGPVSIERVAAAYARLASQGSLHPEDVTGSFWGQLADEFSDGQEGIPIGDDTAKKIWVKVATLERHEHIPKAQTTENTGGSPLYCDVPADFDEKDEPKGAEAPYVGEMRKDSLNAPDNSVLAFQDVERKWGADLDSDLPDGYWDQVPVGYALHSYHWFLCEPGWSDEDWFKDGVAELQKSLKDKQKELNDKVKALAKGALSGTVAAPAAPLAGEIAGELTKYVTDYVVELITEKRFDAVNLLHTTLLPEAKGEPFSLVMLVAAGKPVQLWRDQGQPTHPNFTQRYLNPGVDTVCRWWNGQSQIPGSAPRIKHDVAEANKVVVWRKAVEGFGAIVPQRQKKSRYVTLVRADVRHVDASTLPEPV